MIDLDTLWQEKARCRDLNDDTFFPEKSDIGQAKRAQNICGTEKHPRCPVREQCEAFARDTNQKWGIWGGKSTHARRKPPAYLGGGVG